MARRFVFPFILQITFCHFIQSSIAKPVEEKRELGDFSSVADGVFEAIFAETAAEKQTLEAIPISKREELQIGRTLLRDFLGVLKRRGIRVTRKGRDVAYLEQLAREIQPLMRNGARYSQIKVYVAETEVTDASAFPGGFVVCSTGLVDFADSEATLVGVLAHEMSHIDQAHQLRTLRTKKFAASSLSSGCSPLNQVVQSGKLIAKQFVRPYRSEEETDADLDAATWMVKLGYDPAELASFFRKLHQRDQVGAMRIPSFLRTHPYHLDRYRVVEQFSTQFVSANPNVKLYVGRQNLRKRLARSEKVFAE